MIFDDLPVEHADFPVRYIIKLPEDIITHLPCELLTIWVFWLRSCWRLSFRSLCLRVRCSFDERNHILGIAWTRHRSPSWAPWSQLLGLDRPRTDPHLLHSLIAHFPIKLRVRDGCTHPNFKLVQTMQILLIIYIYNYIHSNIYI